MLTVATILDEFSEQCFSPDVNLIRLRSDDYISRITKSGKIDFLLVESVWRGPGNTWKHALVNNGKHPIPSGIKLLHKLLALCKEKKIPSLFWAKEDPVHFDHFIVSAKLFDYVATTDSNCIAKYKKVLGHNRVFALPFAAQPAIHIPVGLKNRLPKVCFAGTCRDKQYPNRKAAMDIVLQPAIQYGLHIYDRHKVGASGEDFPSIYSSCLQGGVPYDKVVSKYQEYRVFLNVNSIDNSPTMFSRRVFELLSCGTPVISSPSIGISMMLPEVMIAYNAQETKGYLNKIMHDDVYWEKLSKAGMDRISSGHTYHHRLDTICTNLNLRA